MTLRARSLSFSFSRVPVIAELSFSVTPGLVHAVLGPNGAGKSTLLRLLLGDLVPTGGEVTLELPAPSSRTEDNAPHPERPAPISAPAHVHRLAESQRAMMLAYVPQNPSVAFGYTLAEYLSMGLLARRVSPREPVRQALLRLGLDGARSFDELSAGQQQRAALARAMLQLSAPMAPISGAPNSPDMASSIGAAFVDSHQSQNAPARFILADEPLSAMDPHHQLESISLLRSIAASGIGVVIVLHDVLVARAIADRVLILGRDGRLACEGPVHDTLTPAALERVFGVAFVEVGSNASALVPRDLTRTPKPPIP
ncbi:MAG: ABC transporter ATP-binding protein [Planctomycetota bacterium]|nr:ABC transporter ATP-binding protein [Planctomycetota bacterium]